MLLHFLNVVEMPSECRQNVVRMPSECRQNAVRMPSECHQNAVGMPSECRRNAVRMPWDCRQNAVIPYGKPAHCNAEAASSSSFIDEFELETILKWDSFPSAKATSEIVCSGHPVWEKLSKFVSVEIVDIAEFGIAEFWMAEFCKFEFSSESCEFWIKLCDGTVMQWPTKINRQKSWKMMKNGKNGHFWPKIDP